MIVLALLTSGCATYIKSRANDLADCCSIRGGIGPGIGVRTQLTNFVNISVGGCYQKNIVGYFGRNTIDVEKGGWAGIPIPQIGGPLIATRIIAYPHENEGFLVQTGLGIAALLCTDVRQYEETRGDSYLVLLPESATLLGVINILGFGGSPRESDEIPYVRKKFFVEFGGSLGYVSFDAGFNPVEFIDFLLGWTTLDITGDD